MSTTSQPRSTRNRPAKPPLSKDVVIDAALRILKTEGLAAVSMRRVAAELDTGPSSLYVYVDGREGLVHAMHDRVSATIALEPSDPTQWRSQLHGVLGRMRQALIAHPGFAAASMAEPPNNDATLRILENLLGILLAAGLDPQDAAWAADVLAMLVTYAAIEAEARVADDQQLAEDVRDTFAALAPEAFPLIAAHSEQLVAGSTDERFRFAIDVVIDGLLARANPAPPATKPRSRRRP